MYLWNYLPVAITFGRPATKEVYEYYSTASPTEKARLTIIYDSDDNPVSGSARPSYLNDTGTNANGLTGWLAGGTGAVEHLDYLTKVDATTLSIKMYDSLAMAYLGQVDTSDYKLFSDFKRTAVGVHNSSTFANRAGSTTAYTAIRIE